MKYFITLIAFIGLILTINTIIKHDEIEYCKKGATRTWLVLNKKTYNNDEEIKKVLNKLYDKVCYKWQ